MHRQTDSGVPHENTALSSLKLNGKDINERANQLVRPRPIHPLITEFLVVLHTTRSPLDP